MVSYLSTGKGPVFKRLILKGKANTMDPDSNCFSCTASFFVVQLDISSLEHGTPADLRKRAMLFVRANK